MIIKKGFTLIELMVAILILSLTFGLIFPKVKVSLNIVKITNTKTTLDEFKLGIINGFLENSNMVSDGTYNTVINKYISKGSELTSNISRRKDPWGTSFKIESTSTSGTDTIKVISACSDITYGTDDDCLLYVIRKSDGSIEYYYAGSIE